LVARVAAVSLVAACALAAEKRFAPYAEVKDVLASLPGGPPPQLRDLDQRKWNAWSRETDRTIRARLDQGGLDSMVHLLLFGTSFTAQPRVQVDQIGDAARGGLLRARLLDLLQGLRAPGGNERLTYVRNLLRSRGLNPDSPSTGTFILENVERVLRERIRFSERLEEAKRRQKSGVRFGQNSSLYRDRGVSLDTTIPVNFGVEQALADLKKRGLLGPIGVARAAIVGPGLDFTDKESGYDYYPQQTLQPFALWESLVRLELATPGGLRITAFDISPRVLDHLRQARDQAGEGRGYTVQLPRDPGLPATAEFVRYWREFGGRSGEPAAPLRPPPGLEGLEARAVLIRPEVVLACEPGDLNIVVERLELRPQERFDLVVATNVFVYYDDVERALALHNVAAMLKRDGILVTNDDLPLSPSAPMESSGFTSVWYADQPRVGDSLVWYRKR
jgi:hypothetical protein